MRKAVLGVLALALATSAAAGELYVLPVVADGVAGRFGSLWETQIRIVKVNPTDNVVIRRAWVCLEGGGVVDDPLTAPSWELSWHPTDIIPALLLNAAELLVGTGAQTGGVALDVEGGEVLINVSIVDVSIGGFVGGSEAMPYGIGQTYGASRAPLQGASHIAWIGGCYGEQDLDDHCDHHYRNNVGLLNPNPEPAAIELTALPFVQAAMWESDEVISLPPYGWRQADLPLSEIGGFINDRFTIPRWSFPLYGVVNVKPQSELPYYAYVSVVYTSPAEASTPRISDPEFQLAQPGAIVEYSELP